MGGTAMEYLTSTEGQAGLPRYFARVFAVSCDMAHGRLDFVLPDGRRFRANGRAPGPVARPAVGQARALAAYRYKKG